MEVIVVDNASPDNSLDYLAPKFSSVHFIQNKENLGFAKANNQALAHARGKYILFLNPDTILPEDIFSVMIEFMESHPKAGGLGIRMIDGAGKFLPESKRGFPTAWRSFSKLSGLSSIFPKTKLFAGYNLGHLDERKTHQVESLVGACMLVRKDALEVTGGFDERFFMYAEDIDLSKRIMEAGFANFYLGEKTIIHFKGESTIRDRKYVKNFYAAMVQYLDKHYKGSTPGLSIGMMKAGIFLRSLIASSKLKEANSPNSINHVALKGDSTSVQKLRTRLSKVGKNLEESPISTLAILCEGADFSFGRIIGEIENSEGRKTNLIHSSGSSSIVGSADREGQGIAIELPPV